MLLFAAATALPADAPPTNQPEDILGFLNQTVVWYRLLASQQDLVKEPNDAVFLNQNRLIADEVVRLAFEFARSEAQQITAQDKGKAANTQAPPPPDSSQYQNLVSLVEKSKQRLEQEQHELDGFKQQLATASAGKRKLLEAELAESEDEIELLKARYETLQNMLQYASGMNTWTGSKGLQAQIEELAHTVPAAISESSKASGAGTGTSLAAPSSPAAPAATDNKTAPTGIFGLIAEVFDSRRKLSLLDRSLQSTDELADASKLLRSPLIARIREFTQRSDELADQPSSQDAAVLAQQQAELKGLTKDYKQLSAAILPLAKQNILFDLYKHNVSNWQREVQTRYSQLLRGLLLRLGTLAGILIAIFAISHLWRKTTFRYVQDGRRRHQFLIVRRIIVVPVVFIILIVAFASGLGSVTLFAGITTAGLAVALQNMIQSVAGYFVLIGKYGVRVGDRVQVAGVTGDVTDIGMVRLHLVEISGGPGARPTGRVVAFSNAVVFQPDEGFFKQIPGTNFAWHEVLLTLSPDSDYRQVEERMLKAVNKVFDAYKDKMEPQQRGMERVTHGLPVGPLAPESRLRLTGTGTQVVVRYPVEVAQSAEVDDRVTREVLDATGREPEVQISQEQDTAQQDSEKATETRKSGLRDIGPSGYRKDV
ncbi:MAG TPA: mechanosensitive ion channel domain-containing protein [Candidatus Angelobacter sp.]